MNIIDADHKLYKTFREVLGENYLSFSIDNYSVEEGAHDEYSTITISINQSNRDQPIVITSQGDGAIDALFNGMLQAFASEYRSLNTIRFAAFSVGVDLKTKIGFSGSDSKANVEVVIENSYKKQFGFSRSGRSLLWASMNATLSAVEFFINSEKTYINAYRALQHHKAQNRQDMVDVYSRVLVELVHTTSYSDIIEDLKKSSESR